MSGAAPARAAASLPEVTGRLIATAVWRTRRMLGLRRTVRAEGVKYTERTAEPLHRALSRHGQGVKEFDAEFAEGSRMRITCTRDRVYADLSRPSRLEAIEAAEAVVMPGMRVLVLEGGTGWAGERVSRRVGPSGAVVSLDRDEESVKFAQRRYRLKNVAFEIGDVNSVKGETDGAFDAAIAIGAFTDADVRAPLEEIWRVVGPGGTLVLGMPRAREAGDGVPGQMGDVLRQVAGETAKIEELGAADGRWTVLAAVPA